MVPGAPPRLTRIGFRRDVRFFLAALVGFLIVVILALLLLLQTTTGAAADQFEARWNLAADSAAAVMAEGMTGGADAESLLVSARSRFAIDGAHFDPAGGGSSSRSGVQPGTQGTTSITRAVRGGTATFVFDATPLDSLRTKFFITAAIGVAGTVMGAVLLALYLPRITRPIEDLLDSASAIAHRHEDADEAHYLIETFKSSIAKLQEQETELKRLHGLEKSRADELQLVTATLTRSLASGFIAIDAQGNIVDLNSSAREILRLGEREVAGSSLVQIFGDQPFSRHLQHALDNRETVSRREVVFDSGAEEVVVGLTSVPLVGEEERFLGVLALFADLTELRGLEARVREMQTLADLGEISAGIAHEFRNSLSTILGYLKLAQRDPLPQPAGDRVRNAESEAVVLSRAVEGLLNFARPMEAELQDSDLAAVASETVARLGPATEGIDLKLDLQPAEVRADRALLSRAIENLLRNAIDSVRQKYPDGGGRLSVRSRRMPFPTLEIEDDGIGLNPEDAPRMMLPFQSGKAAGLGLGLPLARKIVLLHGGTLSLAGQPGQGAVATLEFVANASLGVATSAPAPPALMAQARQK